MFDVRQYGGTSLQPIAVLCQVSNMVSPHCNSLSLEAQGYVKACQACLSKHTCRLLIRLLAILVARYCSCMTIKQNVFKIGKIVTLDTECEPEPKPAFLCKQFSRNCFSNGKLTVLGHTRRNLSTLITQPIPECSRPATIVHDRCLRLT